ncbi:hypothetical protein K431DRAFT_74890 [Polychaeton citri CBS 116435]|uniref:Uncharacterized protein n=1 Tax=Polychaeton citri CBS 116435 TaxID=1314669 RepID=A0A9P4UNZ5_9PEZI|nr:hypothetical protein K431DRAFT_74890 [Polychaeton citri CBS 116435]
MGMWQRCVSGELQCKQRRNPVESQVVPFYGTAMCLLFHRIALVWKEKKKTLPFAWPIAVSFGLNLPLLPAAHPYPSPPAKLLLHISPVGGKSRSLNHHSPTGPKDPCSTSLIPFPYRFPLFLQTSLLLLATCYTLLTAFRHRSRRPCATTCSASTLPLPLPPAPCSATLNPLLYYILGSIRSAVLVVIVLASTPSLSTRPIPPSARLRYPYH